MSKVINRNGYTLDFDNATVHMDPDICESICDSMGISDSMDVSWLEQEFFTAYEYLHEFVYGEVWELSKANPCL